jgi:hypothetical protein
MTITDWRTLGRDHAIAGKPYNPPPFGPIFQAYTQGYDEGKNQ